MHFDSSQTSTHSAPLSIAGAVQASGRHSKLGGPERTPSVQIIGSRWKAPPCHGPYPSAHMNAWRRQGYFTGARVAFVRRVGGGAAGNGDAAPSKSLKDDLVADLEDSDDDAGDGDGAGAGAAAEAWVRSDTLTDFGGQ